MDHNLLVSELQSLIVETKRRHPEVKEASEHALEILKTKPLSPQVLAQNGEKLLSPIRLGCKTKVVKIIGISISALQRLVALKGVATASLPAVFQTLSSAANQAVEIQLKILQTILSILTHNQDTHDDVLGSALLICFKLQDSRVSVVSSTAAATLRQAVMVIYDRLAHDASPADLSLKLSHVGEKEEELKVTASAMDAFNIFSDLCLLTAAGGGSGGFSLWGKGTETKPMLLKLSSLQRTFGLELIESILSGYESSFKQHSELLYLLSHSLDPLLIQLLGEKHTFPIALRVCRLIFLLIRSFAEQLPLQVETYLSILLRIGMGESEGEEGSKREHVPSWLRGLSLEILRGICGDGALLQTIWTNFDKPDGSNKIFSKIINSLGRLVNEKPALLGIGSQMHGLGVPHPDMKEHGGTYLNMGIGMVASAASAGMSTVGHMIGSAGGGLGSHSTLKLKLIDQHDKAEAPPIPDTYIYLLALQSLDSVAEGIYISSSNALGPEEAVKGMAESSWPALLAALSYGIGTNLSDGLFAEVLCAIQDFTVACGTLNLNTPRDAFISTLGKFAVPPPVVSAMQTYLEGPQSRSGSTLNVDSIGLGALGVGGGSSGPPSLSERNLACLRSIVTTARILASSLGEEWHDVLEVLQNANFLLATKKPTLAKKSSTASPSILQSPQMPTSAPEAVERPEVFDDLDLDSMQTAIDTLFDGTRDMNDEAFKTFMECLCRLSSEMIGLDNLPAPQVVDLEEKAAPPMSPSLSLSPGAANKRRASGINIAHSIKSDERSFSLTKLRLVAMINLQRLVSKDPGVGWQATTQHLLAVARHLTAASAIRLQASDALGELLLGAIRVGKETRVQHQVFDVLVRQVDPYPISNILSTDYDVRVSGYSTLNHILESSGHSLEVGWKMIFEMLNAVCKDTKPSKPVEQQEQHHDVFGSGPMRPTSLSKGDVNLVRVAFPSLNLICTDFLSSLDSDAMRQCIACLGCFGRQKEDVNITLAAIGLLWNVSDSVQGGQTDSRALWLYLLTEMLDLGRDSRLEVRSSSMQTLFRCIELHGSKLPQEVWQEVLDKIVFPLLESSKNDEAAVLAITSVGNLFSNFFALFTRLSTFQEVYKRFLGRLEVAFEAEPPACATASLKALEKVISTIKTQSDDLDARDFVLDSTWTTIVSMSENQTATQVYTQDTLIAFVRVASLLHDQLTWTEERLSTLSSILRSIMTYSKSPEYRPDVDVASPLQTSVIQLISTSSHLGPSLILGDLAAFASLAYMVEQGTKLTFVAVSKICLPKLASIFVECTHHLELYEDGTVDSVLGALCIPIKLKYDCPAANKYGDALPLWKIAISAATAVLPSVSNDLESLSISQTKLEAIWSRLLELTSAILLADNSDAGDNIEEDEAFVMPLLQQLRSTIIPRLGGNLPDHIIEIYGEMLRKASRLYTYDVKHITGGTTAPAIPDISEAIRYWAFDLLLGAVSSSPSLPGHVNESAIKEQTSEHSNASQTEEDRRRVAKLTMPAFLTRIEGALRQFIDDAKLRGQVPLGRIRDDELLYILRHIATLRLAPGTIFPKDGHASDSIHYTSPRAHLFRLYPLILELAFLRGPLPSMWVFPKEYAQLFETAEVEESVPSDGGGGQDRGFVKQDVKDPEAEQVNGLASAELSAGDGEDLIEVGTRDIARRCLELVGAELALGAPKQ